MEMEKISRWTHQKNVTDWIQSKKNFQKNFRQRTEWIFITKWIYIEIDFVWCFRISYRTKNFDFNKWNKNFFGLTPVGPKWKCNPLGPFVLFVLDIFQQYYFSGSIYKAWNFEGWVRQGFIQPDQNMMIPQMKNSHEFRFVQVSS